MQGNEKGRKEHPADSEAFHNTRRDVITINKRVFCILILIFAFFASPAFAAPVDGVSLNSNAILLQVGQTSTLVATVSPADADDKRLTWQSSNNSIATVSITGHVRAIAPGRATITVTTVEGGFTATCEVEVERSVTPVTGVKLTPTSFSLGRGEIGIIEAVVLPDEATGKNVTWSSSNPAVAEVYSTFYEDLPEGTTNPSAQVQALAPGTARITVRTIDGGFTAFCDVTVREATVRVTGVRLNRTAMNLSRGEVTGTGAGQQNHLIATVSPDGATGKHVNWTSSDTSVVIVQPVTDTSDGKPQAQLQGISEGTARITATTLDGGFTAFCDVTVRQPVVPVTGVSLNYTALDIAVGQILETLVATITPTDATGKHVIWTSSNNSIAKVDAIRDDDQGRPRAKVTGITEGRATLTVQTVDGGFTAYCVVEVKPTGSVTGVEMDHDTLTVFVGSKRTIGAYILPDQAANKHVTWRTNNSSVATVRALTSAAGGPSSDPTVRAEIEGHSPGEAIITVRTTDGGYEAECEVSVVRDTGGAVEGGCSAFATAPLALLLAVPLVLMKRR